LEPWSRALSLSYEKEVLGFYLTDHPLRGLEVVGRIAGAQTVEKLGSLENKSKVQILGLVGACREIITKKGTRMAFARLEDTTGGVEMVVFPDTFAQYERVLKSDGPLLASGTLEREEGAMKLIAEQLRSAEDLFKQIKKITLDIHEADVGKLPLLRAWAEKNPGEVALSLRLHLQDLRQCVELDVKAFRGIRASSDALDGLFRLEVAMGFQ
jgi:DNA polymerase-3 subunit alpha